VVEARRPENDVERLPFAGLLGRVDAWRRALVEVAVARPRLRTRIDAAAVTAGERALQTVTILNLDLVTSHQLDPGVRPLGDQELDVCLQVGERLPGDEVRKATGGTVDQDALARRS